MKLLGKKFDEIKFSDIQSLVDEKVPENEVLDYKMQLGGKDGTKKIAELISALANTYGGFIVIGVKGHTDSNKPEFIVDTLTNEKDLEHNIDYACFDHITPPITNCERKMLEDPNSDKKVFIIQVLESDLTPHATENNTTVYYKTKSQKRGALRNSLAKADLDRIEWLKDRRKKFIERRESLVTDSIERNTRISKQLVLINPFAKPGESKKDYSLSLVMVPTFPREELCEYKNLTGIVEIQINNEISKVYPFLSITNSQKTNYNFGRFVKVDGGDYCATFDYNIYGLYSYRMNELQHIQASEFYISIISIRKQIGSALKLGIVFLNELGYSGSVLVSLELRGILNSYLVTDDLQVSTQRTLGLFYKSEIEDNFSMESTLSSVSNTNRIKEIETEYIERLSHLFNMNISN